MVARLSEAMNKTVNVVFCAACGGRHKGLEFHSLGALIGPPLGIEYRATCPETGQTIFARLKEEKSDVGVRNFIIRREIEEDPRITNGAGPREVKRI